MKGTEYEMTMVMMDGKQIHADGSMEEMLKLVEEEKKRGIRRVRIGMTKTGGNEP